MSRVRPNLLNKKIGNLLVLELSDVVVHGTRTWKCLCDCGTITYQKTSVLNKTGHLSCGCKKSEDLTGRIYGLLTVIKRNIEDPKNWDCLCLCGNTVTVYNGYLKIGDTRSCGCLKHKRHIPINLTGTVWKFITVIKICDDTKHGKNMWECLCACGKICYISTGGIKNSKRGSCGCRGLKPWEPARNYLVNMYIWNAGDRGYTWGLSTDECESLFKGDCFYCGRAPEQSVKQKQGREPYIYNGIDRKDNDLGYFIENCLSCCGECNRKKGKLSFEDFIESSHKIHFNLINKGL